MVKECLIIGQPNAGKTLFMVNFIEFLGYKHFDLLVASPKEQTSKTYTITQGRHSLVSEEPNHTRISQSVEINLPVGKGKKRISLTDTVGLSDGIHSEKEIRQAMASTISQIRSARLIIHIIDGAALGDKEKGIMGLKDIDFQISQFARATKGYLMLCNKMDLPGAEKGYQILCEEFDDILIFPISAFHKTGFQEVKKNVARLF